MATTRETQLGAFLRDRRAKVDPASLGIRPRRRRTPGLRREEVAQRAEISATWYTWLEQGRGGAPSAEVLDRVAGALLLTPDEREHLFLLAQNRPPEVRPHPAGDVPVRLRRVLDALETSPALVKNATWDILAWNRAATAVLTDYAALAPGERNLLRLLFSESRLRVRTTDWEGHARLVVATFRRDTTRIGASESARALAEELSRSSPAFAAMWMDHEVASYAEGRKHVVHAVAGRIELEYSTFAVDGHPDLGLVICNPATDEDRARVRSLLG